MEIFILMKFGKMEGLFQEIQLLLEVILFMIYIQFQAILEQELIAMENGMKLLLVFIAN